MNKTTLIIAVSVLFLIAGVMLAARYSGNSQTRILSASLSSLVPMGDVFFDFGAISMANGKVSRDFSLKNDGPDPLVLEKIYTSCMCTEAKVIAPDGKIYGSFGMPGHAGPSKTNIEIKPQENFTVQAIFDPAAHGPSGVGINQRAIYVETNSQKTPKVELSFEAEVNP